MSVVSGYKYEIMSFLTTYGCHIGWMVVVGYDRASFIGFTCPRLDLPSSTSSSTSSSLPHRISQVRILNVSVSHQNRVIYRGVDGVLDRLSSDNASVFWEHRLHLARDGHPMTHIHTFGQRKRGASLWRLWIYPEKYSRQMK